MKYCVFLGYVLLHNLPISMYLSFSGHLRCLFILLYFVFFFGSAIPLHALKIVFLATEEPTHCRSVALGEDRITAA